MSKAKIIVASAIFLLMTVVKFISPDTVQRLRVDLVPAIAPEVNYKDVMTRLGGYLSFGESEVLKTGQSDEDSDLSLLETPTPEPTPELETTETPEPSTEPTPEPTPEPEPTETPIPDVVAAFLESQAQYADQAVPANVSYDMPELPFTFVTPIGGIGAEGFGFRMHPIEQVIKFHYGTDMPALSGTDIHAFADGTVAEAGEMNGYGKYIVINHKDSYSTLYAHCNALLVSAGETVGKGQVIGRVGATGDVTGPHLHFELRKDRTYLNPEYYIT